MDPVAPDKTALKAGLPRVGGDGPHGGWGLDLKT